MKDIPAHLTLVPTPKSSLPVGTALDVCHVRATGDTWLAACVGLQRGGEEREERERETRPDPNLENNFLLHVTLEANNL